MAIIDLLSNSLRDVLTILQQYFDIKMKKKKKNQNLNIKTITYMAQIHLLKFDKYKHINCLALRNQNSSNTEKTRTLKQ